VVATHRHTAEQVGNAINLGWHKPAMRRAIASKPMSPGLRPPLLDPDLLSTSLASGAPPTRSSPRCTAKYMPV